MGNNFTGFSKEDAMRLLNSPAGQELAKLLQNMDGAKLQKVKENASAGNFNAAKQDLQPILDSPQFRELLKQLEG